ncbi:FkbM family methyltransferase [Paraburkholderia sp. RL17-347-BIC-D]|uniref:FkbM family methyltransferase n=1 Tax=Paraburkholderia sp. RL17-347-BIC-D TaxID=3031632 RepID=UPI0038B7572B
MSNENLLLSQLDGFIRTTGTATFRIGDRSITLDLANRHERAYAATLLLHVRHPQSDIDTFLFKHFVAPGDSVLDAGANIGFTALEFMEVGAKKVIAVEPVPELFKRLSTVSDDQIIAVDRAISSNRGYAEITVSRTHNQGSSLKSEILEMFPAIFGDSPQKVVVSLTTIDDLAEQYGHFDVWKLDIEGAEIDALHGAIKTLREHPPRAIITELFGDFAGPFISCIAQTHPHAYRAFIRTSDYQLELADASTATSDKYYFTSPMYVFLREPIVD